ncbi:MAG: GNAT family N-acetyltransferase [Myxococcaceae bacterium]
MPTGLTPKHAEQGHRGAFFLEKEGERLAEMTFTRSNPKLVLIDHTEVSDLLRGQGAGRELLDALVKWARESQTKVIAVCPFAKAQFEKDATIRDVLST